MEEVLARMVADLHVARFMLLMQAVLQVMVVVACVVFIIKIRGLK